MENQGNDVGKSIGNYRIRAFIGSGGFGNVYRAEHFILTERTVAIKILHTYLDSEQDCHRFLQEAHLLEHMHHPHILHIFDVGIENRVPYLVVEFSPNGSLRDLIKQFAPNVLPINTSLSILSQISQALEYAHQLNIVHRDLKPENILFNAKGVALLADFGIATQLTTNSVKHVTVSGTPSYMAPEHFQGSASKKSDQYALGCIAYELFTGQVPFTAPDFFALGFKHLTERAIVPTQLNPTLPINIEDAIMKAMSKQREDRFANIRAFMTAMQGYDDSYDSTVISGSQTQMSPMQSTSLPTQVFSQSSASFTVAQASSTDLYTYKKPHFVQQSDQETPIASERGPVTPLPSHSLEWSTREDEQSYAPSQHSLMVTSDHEKNSGLHLQFPLTPVPTQTKGGLAAMEIRPRSETGQAFPINGGKLSRGSIFSVSARNSGRRRMIVAITGAVVVMMVIALLLVVFLPALLSPRTITYRAYTSLQGTVMATNATTNLSSGGIVTHPTSVPTSNAKNQTAPGSTPISTQTAHPVPTPTLSPTASPLSSETLQVNFNTSNATGIGISTQHSYSGKVSITISGSGQAYLTRYSDAFYIYTDTSGNLLASPYTDIRWVLYINGNTAATSVGLPAYNNSHIYTVSMSLSQPGTINFGIRDSENSDNTGYYTITVQQQ
jgi:serine/threonine protein kinase